MRRVVLAGLLARSPRALILDEPLAGLDAASARGLLRLLEDLRRNARADGGRDLARLLRARGPVPAHSAPAGRGPCGRADDGRGCVMTAPARRQQRRPVVLLRPVPGRSVIHDLWAGTKLIVVAGIGVLLTFYPGWVPIGAVTALVLGGGAGWPTFPAASCRRYRGGCGCSCFSAGSPPHSPAAVPSSSSSGSELGLGGLLKFLRITALSIVLLALGGMVSWTTNVAEIAPAVAKFGRPLRALRVPVDDWAVALALALRAFPMLIDEFRILYAARSLRPKPVLTTRRDRRRRWAVEVVDLIAAAIIVALRRADEMGDAITARGGAGQISAAPSGPKRRDWVALSIGGVGVRWRHWPWNSRCWAQASGRQRRSRRPVHRPAWWPHRPARGTFRRSTAAAPGIPPGTRGRRVRGSAGRRGP